MIRQARWLHQAYTVCSTHTHLPVWQHQVDDQVNNQFIKLCESEKAVKDNTCKAAKITVLTITKSQLYHYTCQKKLKNPADCVKVKFCNGKSLGVTSFLLVLKGYFNYDKT